MQAKANLQLIYVSDIDRSTKYYSKLFEAQAVFSSPRYVAFSAGGDALFAIWTGGDKPEPGIKRYSEIGIMLESNEAVDALYEQWHKLPDICIEKKLYTDVFGHTFLVKDPDGHLIRVCPRD